MHLSDWPVAGPRDVELEEAMAVARATVALGLAARAQAKMKLRQPLHEAVVVAAGAERSAIERLAPIVRDELNVKRLRFVSEADELGSYTVKPNYRSFGPAVREGDAAGRGRGRVFGSRPRRGRFRGRRTGGNLDRRPRPRARRRRSAARAPAARRLSARARGLTRRRAGGSRSTSRSAARASRARSSTRSRRRARTPACASRTGSTLSLAGPPELLDAARAFETYIAGETLATSVSYGEPNSSAHARIDGQELTIGVARAA